MKHQPTPHGLIIQPIVIDEHWIFGSSSQAPGEILQPDRDWRPYLPVHSEIQNLNGIEPNACTIFGDLNVAQTVIKRKYGEDRDYSNRYLAVMSGTDPAHGNNPHKVLETLRNGGDCDESAWPFDDTIDTVEKFYAPVPDAVKTLAKQFVAEWKLTHDWVPTTPQQMWAALQYSPLGLSVYAWAQDADGYYYRPAGNATDNHWVELVYAEWGKYWLIRDSYSDHGVLYKKVRWDTQFALAKRVVIERQTDIQSSGWQWFVEFLKSLWPFPVVTPPPPLPPTPLPTPIPPTPPPAPHVSKIPTWALTIEKREGGKPGDLNITQCNPGNLKYTNYTASLGGTKGVKGSDGGYFCRFPTRAAGLKALEQFLTDACNGKLQSYKPTDTILKFTKTYANPPSDDYAKAVATACGVSVSTNIKELL